MKKLIMGCYSLLALLFLAQVGLAQPRCVAVAPQEVVGRINAALQALSPEQEHQTLTRFEGLAPGEQHKFLEGLRRTLQILPERLRQPFINGVFNVSPHDRQIATEVLQEVGTLAMLGSRLPDVCPGSERTGAPQKK